MTGPVIEFWFDFSSGYAYFAALDIEPLANRYGHGIVWRPYLLGPAVKEQDGAAGEWRRLAKSRRVKFVLPDKHPLSAEAATRAFYALEALGRDQAVVFAKAVFAAYFGGGLDPSNVSEVADLAERLGHDRDMILAALADPDLKSLVHARSTEALAKGVRGSPSFIVQGEPFFGWDRLTMIDQWLAEGGG
jgi:2-hydroxychromene-2-carboxylate isomerase